MDPIARALAELEINVETDPRIQEFLYLNRSELYAWLSEQFRMIAEEAYAEAYGDEETDDDLCPISERYMDEQMAGTDGPAECCICWQQVQLGEVVTELACGHWFDTECILRWLDESRDCPLCRQTVEAEWMEWDVDS